jgi:hypothetical protein
VVAPHGLVDLGLLIRVSPARHLPLGRPPDGGRRRWARCLRRR